MLVYRLVVEFLGIARLNPQTGDERSAQSEASGAVTLTSEQCTAAARDDDIGINTWSGLSEPRCMAMGIPRDDIGRSS
jgi:hypothetical protein